MALKDTRTINFYNIDQIYKENDIAQEPEIEFMVSLKTANEMISGLGKNKCEVKNPQHNPMVLRDHA